MGDALIKRYMLPALADLPDDDRLDGLLDDARLLGGRLGSAYSPQPSVQLANFRRADGRTRRSEVLGLFV